MFNPSNTSTEVVESEGTDERNPRRRPRVLFLNRSYWPDGEATGQLLTELSEDLADRFDVTVVAGLPNTNPSNEPYRTFRSEVRRGVRILRVPHTRLPKGWLPGRAINFITFLASATIRSTFCRRQDVIVVETDPFLLSLIGVMLRWRHRANLVVYLQDIHPDIGVAIGRLKESCLTRTLRRSLNAVYRRAERVVVLSRDMRNTLVAAGVPEHAVVCIPNWIDTKRVRPSKGRNRFRTEAGIDDDAFVVMYSGNLGITQQLDRLLDAAEMLRSRSDVSMVFIGGGSAEAGLREEANRRGLTNVRFFPYQPKEALGDSLSAADLHAITVHPAALAFLMPSKLYGILAAARAVLAAAPSDSELAEIVRTHRLGYVVPPGDARAMAAAIGKAVEDRAETTAMGIRGRQLAEETYDRAYVTRQFGDLLADVYDEATRPQTTTVEA
ncbi:MAG: glycosyltransferase family 4 protein [Planctomycetota bacterium]|nr:glycosyltransferase family 4 protein [Planctomycetaceae bacterium]MDQ3329947.1 glycosyltransferase family 4 protein [Planctomycetota bacterium]